MPREWNLETCPFILIPWNGEAREIGSRSGQSEDFPLAWYPSTIIDDHWWFSIPFVKDSCLNDIFIFHVIKSMSDNVNSIIVISDQFAASIAIVSHIF